MDLKIIWSSAYSCRRPPLYDTQAYIFTWLLLQAYLSMAHTVCKHVKATHTYICHTAIENLSDPIGYLLDFTNPYYTALAGNMKARAKKDNSF